MKRISSSYVYWYNKKYDRCGHLFQERFKSEAVESDAYFLTVLKYIHQNPVKARITKEPKAYLWSSYNEYIGYPIYTDTGFALELFSTEENNDQCLEYKEKINISDKELMDYFHKWGVGNISELQRLEKEKRNDYIRKIK